MITYEQIIAIGTVAKPFGTQGQVLCRTVNELWQGGEFLILSLDNIPVPFRVTDYRYHGEDILFTLKDIDTEDKARSLCNHEAFMLRSDVSSVPEDEMLWTDFVGWQAVDTDQGSLGTVTAVDDTTENILAALDNGTLIPLHEDFIREIDDQSQVLTITLPFQVE